MDGIVKRTQVDSLVMVININDDTSHELSSYYVQINSSTTTTEGQTVG